MIELDKVDKETGQSIVSPFYLLQDGSKINFHVFRLPSDYQYACLNSDTFDICKDRLITPRKIEAKRLEAQLDGFENAMVWHCEYVDRLWMVSQVQNLDNWYHTSKFVGYFEGHTVKDFLPKTYAQFQGKRDELRKRQEEFDKWISSIKARSRAASTQPVPF